MILQGAARLRRIRENLSTVKCGRLGLARAECPEALTIVGFGPTLNETWKDIKPPVMTTSGAYDFLVAQGIVPDYHIEVHPTAQRATFLKHPKISTVFLIASTCHPAVFRALKNRNVLLWHPYHDASLMDQAKLRDELDPDNALIGGGTNTASRAVAVGRHLGFRRFITYGIDCCWSDDKKWAGKHPPNGEQEWVKSVGGREWRTSRELHQGAMDFLQERRIGAHIEVRGDNYLAALFAEAR